MNLFTSIFSNARQQLMLLAALLVMSSGLSAQCSFGGSPYLSFAEPTSSTLTTLASCYWGGEYATVTLVGGNTYTFSTCAGSGFDTQLTVFQASDPSNAVAYDDDFCGVQSQVSFVAPCDGDYYVQINQYDCSSNSRCMVLQARRDAVNPNGVACSVPEAPDNDVCSMATPIDCGMTMAGSTQFATESGPSLSCSGTSVAPDVWYMIMGQGGDIEASLCGSSYDTKIDIYEGSCQNLVCVAGNDDDCSYQSRITWNAAANQVYYIRVHGYFGNTGDYSLSVTCTDPCSPDMDAPMLSCASSMVSLTLGASGAYPLTAGELNVSATDPNYCSQVSYMITPSILTCDNLGVTQVAVVAMDQAGNASAPCYVSVNLQAGGSLPDPWGEITYGGTGSASYPSCGTPQFILNHMGNPSLTSDRKELVYQGICGDGEIMAQVQNVSPAAFAGIEFREDMSAGSRRASLETQLTRFVYREIRATTNGSAISQRIPAIGQSDWLRIVRQGDNFTFYVSYDGSNWSFKGMTVLPMPECVSVGFYVESPNANTNATAVFGSVQVYGSNVSLTANDQPQEVKMGGIDQLIIAETAIPTAKVFPNPASRQLTVNLNGWEAQQVELSLVNELGQKVLQRQLMIDGQAQEVLDVSRYNSGMYMLHVRGENQQLIERVVIQPRP